MIARAFVADAVLASNTSTPVPRTLADQLGQMQHRYLPLSRRRVAPVTVNGRPLASVTDVNVRPDVITR